MSTQIQPTRPPGTVGPRIAQTQSALAEAARAAGQIPETKRVGAQEVKQTPPTGTSEQKKTRRGFAMVDQPRYNLQPSSQFQSEATNTLSKSLVTISELENDIDKLEKEKTELQEEKTDFLKRLEESGQGSQRAQESFRILIEEKDREIQQLKDKIKLVQGNIKWPQVFEQLAKISPDSVEFLEKVIIELEKRYHDGKFEEISAQPGEIQAQVWNSLFGGAKPPFNQFQIYSSITKSILDNIKDAERNEQLAELTNTRRVALGHQEEKVEEGKIDKVFTLELATDMLRLYEPMYRILQYLYSDNKLGRLVIFMDRSEDTPIDLEGNFNDILDKFQRLDITPTPQ